MSPDCSCGTGTQGTNLEPTEVVNGRKIGRMYAWCPDIWGYPAAWYVYDGSTNSSGIHRDARKVDLTREYWNNVFQPSLRVWEAGNTPNPDVWCNRSAACARRSVTSN